MSTILNELIKIREKLDSEGTYSGSTAGVPETVTQIRELVENGAGGGSSGSGMQIIGAVRMENDHQTYIPGQSTSGATLEITIARDANGNDLDISDIENPVFIPFSFGVMADIIIPMYYNMIDTYVTLYNPTSSSVTLQSGDVIVDALIIAPVPPLELDDEVLD